MKCINCQCELMNGAAFCTECGTAQPQQAPIPQPPMQQAYSAPQCAPKNGFVDMTKHILLLLFTLGIYHMIWIYKTTEYTDSLNAQNKRGAAGQLLLCMFIPFYSIFWYAKTAELLEAQHRLNDSSFKTKTTVLAVFLPLVAAIIVQDGINKMCAPANTASPAQPAAAATETDAIETIRKYKDLLDAGAVTQAEFDAKKKELLHL